ncbi:Os12g0632401, partial [Oryza sativa Japonica Group]
RVDERRTIHDLTCKDNIGHEDVHSRTSTLGKASAGSLSAIKFTNSQVLTTSRF